MKLYKQSSTAQPLLFLLISSSDHITGLTGATPTVKLGKNGGTGAAPSGTVSEIDSTNLPGLYKVAGNATDTNTLGPLALYATASGADPCNEEYEVVIFDPQAATNLGLTAIPAVASGNAGALLIDGTGTAAISNSGGKILLQATQSGVIIPTVTTVTNQLTAAAIATGIWQDATAGDFTTASSIGKSLFTSGAIPGAAGGLFIAGTNAATAITTGLTAHIIGTVDTLTTYTGNTPQTGDVYALANGANGFVAIAAKTSNIPASPASTTNITAGTITTATNLTNAPTAGDFTATMKSSLNAATPASVTGAVGSVSGNVGGSVASVIGSVGSVTAGVNATSLGGVSTGATILSATGVFSSVALANAPSGGGGGFTGSFTVTFTVTDASANLIQGAELTVPGIGSPGTRTNSSGQLALAMNNGTYTILVAPINLVTFAPQAFTVSGNTAVTIAGTSVVLPTPPVPGQVVGFIYCQDGFGNYVSGATITFQLAEPISGEDFSFSNKPQTAISVASPCGLLTQFFEPGGLYTGYRGNSGAGAAFTFIAPQINFNLQEHIGAP